jgi:repressor LexA
MAMPKTNDLLVHYQSDVNNGEIAVVRQHDTGKMTLKRFYREEGGRVRLQPANLAMAPIYIDDPGQVEVMGRVVKVLPKGED